MYITQSKKLALLLQEMISISIYACFQIMFIFSLSSGYGILVFEMKLKNIVYTKHKKSSSLKSEELEPWYLVFISHR